MYYAAVIKLPDSDNQQTTLEEAVQNATEIVNQTFGENAPSVWPIRVPEGETPSPNILKYQNIQEGQPHIMLRGFTTEEPGTDKDTLGEKLHQVIHKLNEFGEHKSYRFYSHDGYEFEGRRSCLQKQTEHVRLYNL